MQSELLISRKALASNIDFFRGKATSSFMCPMVKANAYGVGDSLIVGELLSLGVDTFGVARVSEGQRLRRLFPQEEFKILVFAPICASQISDYITSELTPVIGCKEDLKSLSELSTDEENILGGVHVKFDLGMTRLGFDLSEAAEVNSFFNNTKIKVLGICGHFSQADKIISSNSKDMEGLNNLLELSTVFGLRQEQVHAPNSAALSLGSFEVGSRPGLSLYGLSDDEDVVKNLEPVLSLKAPLVHIRKVKAGTRVSYGGLWESKEDTVIGVLLIGYADGLPRGLSGKIDLGHEGVSFTQVGAICMDYTMVDLGPKNSLKIGQQLTFFGEEHRPRALSEWASSLGCITYELLVGLGDRLKRRIV